VSRSFVMCILYQIKKNQMGRACRKHRKHKKRIKIYSLKDRTMEIIFPWGIALSCTSKTVRQNTVKTMFCINLLYTILHHVSAFLKYNTHQIDTKHSCDGFIISPLQRMLLYLMVKCRVMYFQKLRNKMQITITVETATAVSV